MDHSKYLNSVFGLEGKTALVTGGAGDGNGRPKESRLRISKQSGTGHGHRQHSGRNVQSFQDLCIPGKGVGGGHHWFQARKPLPRPESRFPPIPWATLEPRDGSPPSLFHLQPSSSLSKQHEWERWGGTEIGESLRPFIQLFFFSLKHAGSPRGLGQRRALQLF